MGIEFIFANQHIGFYRMQVILQDDGHRWIKFDEILWKASIFLDIGNTIVSKRRNCNSHWYSHAIKLAMANRVEHLCLEIELVYQYPGYCMEAGFSDGYTNELSTTKNFSWHPLETLSAWSPCLADLRNSLRLLFLGLPWRQFITIHWISVFCRNLDNLKKVHIFRK